MTRLLVIALLLVAVGAAASEGPVRRYQGENTLYRDTVWEGEVVVDGILTVAPDVTLDIRPGTVVRFTPFDSNADGIGEHEIFIQGRLQAVGTAAAPIVFTSAAADPAPGDWGAINMMVSEQENRLENCRVEYGYRGFHAHFARAALQGVLFRRNRRALQFQESTVRVRDCRIVDNLNGLQFRDSKVRLEGTRIAGNYWGLRCVYSEVTLQDCLIENNLINGANLRDSEVAIAGNRLRHNRRGLYLQRSRGKVAANALSGNSEHGILLEDSDCRVLDNRIVDNGRAGVKWVNSQGRLRGNLLSGNGEYALINDGRGDVDARQNWWGSASAKAIARLVRDAADRSGCGAVDTALALPAAPQWPPKRAAGKTESHEGRQERKSH